MLAELLHKMGILMLSTGPFYCLTQSSFSRELQFPSLHVFVLLGSTIVHFVPQQRFLRSNEKKNENTDIHSNPSMMERESKRKKEKRYAGGYEA